jgi:type III restriction enzyme
VKARRDLDDPDVLAKANAARTWVHYANDHANLRGGKQWRYVLIPHDVVLENATLAGLAARFSQSEIVDEAKSV